MGKIRHSKIISILLILALSLMICMPVFAEDDESSDHDNENIENQTIPSEPANPSIHTVVHAWDVIGHSEEDASYGSMEQAARVFYYIDFEIDEGKEAEVDRLVEEAERRDQARAEEEAELLAEELVANGRYKELIGENNRYEKDWYDSDYDDEDSADDEDSDESVDDGEDEDPDEDIDYDEDDIDEDYDEEYIEDDEDEENVHSGGPYYSKLKETYPHVMMFWFESDGKYYYDYEVDYDGIDFDSIYIEIPHDTFHVIDTVSYKDFASHANYSVQAQLVRLETKESGETAVKETIKELDMNLGMSDATEGELSFDFGELKLAPGNYVVLINIMDEGGAEYLGHNDLNNRFESLEVSQPDLSLDATSKGNSGKKKGSGQVEFPADSPKVTSSKAPNGSSNTSSNKSPNTGDNSKCAIALYFLIILLSIIACIRIVAGRIKT